MKDRFFVSFDKTPIHYVYWPPKAPHRANVLVIHGAGEYAERYEELAIFLNAHDYAVYGMDLRGFGQSGGPRAFAKTFDHYGQDIQALVRLIRKNSNEPLFLCGTSMGGLITAYGTAFIFPGAVDALLLFSPCFGLTMPVAAHLVWMAKILSVLKPTHLFDKPDLPELLTHDPVAVAQHREDPRIFRKISARTYTELARLIENPEGIAKAIHVPVAVLQAGDDQVVDAEASRRFCEAVPQESKRFIRYEGFFHEIIHEIGKERVFNDVLTWLNECLETVKGKR